MGKINIYVYSDESGVFDKAHNDVFVFGGVVLLGFDELGLCSRRYVALEKFIRNKRGIPKSQEIKATSISNTDKTQLFRALNQHHKFAIIINQKRILDRIFRGKKDKQRYLDYAYKVGVKRVFQEMMREGLFKAEDVENVFFYVDEHTTATNGKYELEAALECELKLGTYNINYSRYFEPIFPGIDKVQVKFCNSESVLLVRAADMVANKIYYLCVNDKKQHIKTISKIHYKTLP